MREKSTKNKANGSIKKHSPTMAQEESFLKHMSPPSSKTNILYIRIHTQRLRKGPLAGFGISSVPPHTHIKSMTLAMLFHSAVASH